MASAGVIRLLKGIASPERVEILEMLTTRPHRHSEIARALSIFRSATTRQLRILAAVGLVTRNTRGEFEATGMTMAIYNALSGFEFLVDNQEYFARHDVTALEPSFVSRLGELGRGEFTVGAYQVVAEQQARIRGAGRRVWMISEHNVDDALAPLLRKGVQAPEIRLIRPASRVSTETLGREPDGSPSVRVLPSCKVVLEVTDDSAGVCLPTPDGQPDLSVMITVRDPVGVRWAEDLFLSQWGRAGSPAIEAVPSVGRDTSRRAAAIQGA